LRAKVFSWPSVTSLLCETPALRDKNVALPLPAVKWKLSAAETAAGGRSLAQQQHVRSNNPVTQIEE